MLSFSQRWLTMANVPGMAASRAFTSSQRSPVQRLVKADAKPVTRFTSCCSSVMRERHHGLDPVSKGARLRCGRRLDWCDMQAAVAQLHALQLTPIVGVPRRFSRPTRVHVDHGRIAIGRRSLWTGSGPPALRSGARPGNDRLGDAQSGKRMTGILGYARVSTGDQDVAGQTMRLTQAGALRVFTDVRSGRNMDRPGLQELLAYARRGDTLAVVRLDRLGRSLGELLATVTMLKERGVALLSLEEKIDTSSAAGELVFHVFGAIAHFERRLIAERTKDGIAAARAKGKRPGRQPLDEDRVAAALKLVVAGLSPTEAARQLGLGRSTVYREMNRASLQRAT